MASSQISDGPLSPCHDKIPSACENAGGIPNPAPINVWVVAGPCILVGILEIFTSVTSLECAFTKALKQMKTFVVVFSQSQAAATTTTLNFTLTSVNAEERFTRFSGSFAITAIVVRTLFNLTFLRFDRAGAVLYTVGAGDRDGLTGPHQKPEGPHV